MSDIYPDREYDASVRRTNRAIKLIGVPLVIGLVIACTAGLALIIDKLPGSVRVSNDSLGNVVCYQRYVSRDIDHVRETARIAPGLRGSVPAGSSCAVFDRNGNYISCLRVADEDRDEGLRASDADRGVRAEACLSPR